jgi:hypothetical protein
MTLWRWLWGSGPEKSPIPAASSTVTGVASTPLMLIRRDWKNKASRAA